MIKIYRANRVYNSILDKLYSSQPQLAHLNFSQQMSHFFGLCLNESNFWKSYLESTGEFEVFEVVSNSHNMQQAWARENNLRITNLYEIIIAQIYAYKPDVIYDNTRSIFPESVRTKIKQQLPKVKFIAWDGLPVGSIDYFKGTDLMFTYLDFLINKYTMAGFNITKVPFGFEPSVLTKIKPNSVIYNATFVGSIEYYIHSKRIKFLNDFLNKQDIDIWVGDFNIKKILLGIKSGNIKEIIQSMPLLQKSKGSVYGLDYYSIMQASKISLNIQEFEGAGNIRYIEATGCGTCLLTDWKPDIAEFYKPDEEIVTYKSIPEAIDKIKYLLEHEDIRNKIAIAGQNRTLTDYNFKSRTLQFGNKIKELVQN